MTQPEETIDSILDDYGEALLKANPKDVDSLMSNTLARLNSLIEGIELEAYNKGYAEGKNAS